MKRWRSALALLGLVIGGVGVSGVWASPQNQPGMPTIARMFILNRERSEAIPVMIQGGDVQQVAIIGTPNVNLAPNTTVGSRATRQMWEYQQVQTRSGADVTAALNAAGAEGWEAVGVLPGAAPANTILMKRPK